MPKKIQKYPAYASGMLPVGDGHTLYYELYGNPQGIPVLFFHGGPGGGISDKYKRLFDPKKYNVVLFDQRGAGKSTPAGSLHENNTQKLVSDSVKILDHVKVKKAILYGRSWGSTLALCFAIAHPERTSGMVIGGIFLPSVPDYFFSGEAKSHFPEAWERFLSIVPSSERPNAMQYYYDQMVKGNEKYGKEWCLFEMSLLKLRSNPEKLAEMVRKDHACQIESLLEAHYMVHASFMPDGYILKNAHKIKVPVSIIHGRYDFVCPPADAYKLHKALPGSKLHFTISGHSGSGKLVDKLIMSELDRVAAAS